MLLLLADMRMYIYICNIQYMGLVLLAASLSTSASLVVVAAIAFGPIAVAVVAAVTDFVVVAFIAAIVS